MTGAAAGLSMRVTMLGRVLLLGTGILAAYQIAVGIDGLATLPIVAYTVAFGVILLAALLLLVLGLDVLESPAVVIVSTMIPLGLSLGLVWERIPGGRMPYAVFAVFGFLAVLITRITSMRNRLALVVLAVVHGVAGVTIFLLPILWVASGRASPGFAFVGVGGALIGVGGLLLSLLKAGRPLLSREVILRLLPGLLLAMTAAFVAGFGFG